MRVPPHELRRRLFITFRGEEGLDYGGIARYNILITHNLFYFKNVIVLTKL